MYFLQKSQSFSVQFKNFKICHGAIVFVLNISNHFKSFVKRFKKFC